jgi:hypothetical protein
MIVLRRCERCAGTGELESSDSTEDGWRDCPTCTGTGKVADRRRPDSQLAGAVDPETLERHRWALDAAVRFITENGGNPDVVKSLLVLAEWGQ